MILIYAAQITERLRYTGNFIFQTVLGIEPVYTTNLARLHSAELPAINYSATPQPESIHIVPSSLLTETEHRPFTPDRGNWEELGTLFPTEGRDVPFDLFAATFYLITRYEEYNQPAYDRHRRFLSEKSISFDNGWIETPIVDRWAIKLKHLLQARYPQRIAFNPPSFRFTSTIDIDNPYAYRGKSILLHAYYILSDLLKLRMNNVVRRLKVVFGRETDPFFNFDQLVEWHQEVNLCPLFFAHVGSYGRHDRKTIYPTPFYYRTLRQLRKTHSIGTHPSYSASFSQKRMGAEKKMLAQIVSSNVTTNRQHYLRFHMPHTFRSLAELRITDDYSMAYVPRYGFRSGTCHPHRFFDVERNEVTTLKLHPTIVMDTTLKQYMKLPPSAIFDHICELIDQCCSVNGEFVLLFHNSSLSNIDGWGGWKEPYLKVLHYGAAQQNRLKTGKYEQFQ